MKPADRPRNVSTRRAFGLSLESARLSRRTVLRGLGTAMALPLFDAMLPVNARALEAATAAETPHRLAFLYVPNGVNMADWTPASEGPDFDLPAILQPLNKVRQKFSILSGLTLDKARANGDGGGDHARALSSFLTCRQAYKTDGANIRVGRSVDQHAADHFAGATRYGSLEIGCDKGAQSGNCDSGYSCAYSANLSWRTESTPNAKEVDPKALFERLFEGDRADDASLARHRRQKSKQSVLDFVRSDAALLQQRLGAGDRRKLDEYLTSVRELEQQIARASAGPVAVPEGASKPDGIPESYETHLRLLSDLMVLALQGDLTRVCTFAFANEGSNRSYKFIGVPEGHHDLSHHGNDEAKKAKICQINVFHAMQLAYLLEKLDSVPEGDGTLLDHLMLVYGSGIGDGNAHNHDNLPIVLAGQGCGTLAPGRHVQYPKETPLANLYLSMLDRIGVQLDTHGDSTGRLEGLS